MAPSSYREFGSEDDDDDTEDNIDQMFLTFTVQDTEYAVGLTHVLEIVVGQKVISVPDVPVCITGVINLRGKVMPVMDVRRRFGLTQRAWHDRATIVVVEVAGASTGLAVDAVNDVVQLPSASIDPPIRLSPSSEGLVRGIGKRSDGVAFVLDLGRLLDPQLSPLGPAEPLSTHRPRAGAADALAGEAPRTVATETDEQP